MIFLFYFFIFLLGTAIGSFLGVVVDRIMGTESFWKGRSHCDHCRHKLHWNDLIPLASFALLKGKCRYCHKVLSPSYFFIELVTGLAFAITTFVLLQSNWMLIFTLHYVFLILYYFSLIGSLIAITFTDIKYGIIPFKIVGFALFASLVWFILYPALYFMPFEAVSLGLQTNLLNSLAAGLGAALLFFLLFVITKGRGMGFGDVVFAFLMGFVLGFPNVLMALYLAFVTGAIVALLLVITKKKKFKGDTIPFGPFLVFGTFVSLLWGNLLISTALTFFKL